jgi:hypothetical protein
VLDANARPLRSEAQSETSGTEAAACGENSGAGLENVSKNGGAIPYRTWSFVSERLSIQFETVVTHPPSSDRNRESTSTKRKPRYQVSKIRVDAFASNAPLQIEDPVIRRTHARCSYIWEPKLYSRSAREMYEVVVAAVAHIESAQSVHDANAKIEEILNAVRMLTKGLSKSTKWKVMTLPKVHERESPLAPHQAMPWAVRWNSPKEQFMQPVFPTLSEFIADRSSLDGEMFVSNLGTLDGHWELKARILPNQERVHFTLRWSSFPQRDGSQKENSEEFVVSLAEKDQTPDGWIEEMSNDLLGLKPSESRLDKAQRLNRSEKELKAFVFDRMYELFAYGPDEVRKQLLDARMPPYPADSEIDLAIQFGKIISPTNRLGRTSPHGSMVFLDIGHRHARICLQTNHKSTASTVAWYFQNSTPFRDDPESGLAEFWKAGLMLTSGSDAEILTGVERLNIVALRFLRAASRLNAILGFRTELFRNLSFSGKTSVDANELALLAMGIEEIEVELIPPGISTKHNTLFRKMVLSLHNNGALGICLETDQHDTMQVFLTEDCCFEEGGRKSLVKYICRLLSRVHVRYHLRLAQLMERLGNTPGCWCMSLDKDSSPEEPA